MVTDAEIVEQVLLERQPRSTNDPNYVPWWAKPPHGEKMGTSYTTRSGVTVSSGRVTGRVKAKAPVDSPSVSETPKKPSEPISDDTLSALCDQHGLSHDLYRLAPNRGVAVMRVRNAIKKLGGANG